ncbi:MAG: nucleotidyltransferase family protein [Saprospiraceae bacterium]|jgi:molybdenum cofactor cytidylyltransferase
MDSKIIINKTAILILAAGGSSRLGKPKQLLPMGQSSLLNHVIDVAQESGIDLVVTVLGAYFDEVHKSIQHQNITIIRNEQWQQGMASSIVFSINHIMINFPDIQQVIILLGDQPLLKANDLIKLIELQDVNNAQIVYTDYGKNFGPPILFTKKTFPSLLQLKGDEGAKKIIKTNQYFSSSIRAVGSDFDIDTEGDYETIKKVLNSI